MSTAPTTERRPAAGGDWTELPCPAVARDGAVIASAWRSGRVRVLSALTHAVMPDGDDAGLQWHISITREGRRPKPQDVRRTLRAFGMARAEQDNHHPGEAKHFWLVVDPARRVLCECKADEATIVEPDGYRWTTPADGTACRGCELQRLTGKACPLHSAAAAAGTGA